MSCRTMSYPFRIDYSNRKPAVVCNETDVFKAEQVSTYLRTHRGERLMFPDFGIEDPTFSVFDVADFIEGFSDFYSSDFIKISKINAAESEGVVSDIVIEFE